MITRPQRTGRLDVDTPIRILYVGGIGRSGSTLLASLLAEVHGFYPVGEIGSLWQALERNELCGCGTTIRSCDFWQRVGERAFGGWRPAEVEEMKSLRRDLCRHRDLPWILTSSTSGQNGRSLATYVHALEMLYEAVRYVAECSTIVDSTKDGPYALVLAGARNLRVDVLHLVRDSRAVSFSWQREVEQPQYANHPTLKGEPMTRHGALNSGLRWLLQNAAFHLFRLQGHSRTLVRYEDLVRDPRAEINRLLDRVDPGGRRDLPDTLNANQYQAQSFHTVGGSRIRFKRGHVDIRTDDEWITSMRQRDRLAVTALTLPLLLAYGYR